MQSGAAKLLLSLAVACVSLKDLEAQQTAPAAPSYEAAYNYALEVVLVDKLVGPTRAILVCRDEGLRNLAHQAVAEINDAFGYGKIALQDAESARLEDDSITIFIGSKRKGRQLIEDFGVSSPRAFRGAVYYYWWDRQRRHHIRRGVIVIDETSSQQEFSEDLKYLLLACMGVRSPWVADLHHPRVRGQKPAEGSIFSDFSVAVVRFFDKHVPPGARAWDMRKAFESEWPDFSSAYWNPSNQKTATTSDAPSSPLR
jgi:hypothetical protein